MSYLCDPKKPDLRSRNGVGMQTSEGKCGLKTTGRWMNFPPVHSKGHISDYRTRLDRNKHYIPRLWWAVIIQTSLKCPASQLERDDPHFN